MQLGIVLAVSGSVNLLVQFVGWQLLPPGRNPLCSRLTSRQVLSVAFLSCLVSPLVATPILIWVNAYYSLSNFVSRSVRGCVISGGFGEEFLTGIRGRWRFPAIQGGSNRCLISSMTEREIPAARAFPLAVRSPNHRLSSPMLDHPA
jgi:hypothetical protein